jgi:radical SAM protein with 4Fe4S-binding SPASM domain
MNLGQMEDVLAQFVALVKKWKLPKNHAAIYFTGGEPFMRNDFPFFLEIINKYSDSFLWNILSNGSFLTEDIAQKLKKIRITNFQISLEGMEKTNDEIRGYGSFQKILRAIKILEQSKIPIRISLTLSRQNYKEIRELALQLAPLGVSWLAARRIAPFGSTGNQMQKFVLEPQELRNTYQEIEKINKELKEKRHTLKVMGGCENAVFNDDISSPDLMNYGKCAVNEGGIITLLPDGDALICRRFPIKIGNVLEKSLEEIYYSPLYENFRGENEDIPLECYPCPIRKSCLGGAKCVTYAMTGKTAPDVQCWKLFDSLKESTVYVKRQNWFRKFFLLLKIFRSSNR